MTAARCPFCDIVAGLAPATVLARWSDAIAIKPIDPVTKGHVLVIPREHVDGPAEDPMVTGAVMQRAAEYASATGLPFNLLISEGAEATQSIRHAHVHFVPRAFGDGLPLPWTPQQAAA
ncbi:HIT domain-containing protein [Streptomyces sp. NPDC007100]|uniref:HIT family protein n=1 Tax=Streptomyces sp. NPDC007100 TaxID=3155602 RepID=UPI003411004B